MNESGLHLKKSHLENGLHWFQGYFRECVVSPLEREFPGWPLTGELQQVLTGLENILRIIQAIRNSQTTWLDVLRNLNHPTPSVIPLFKSIMLLYRRNRAAFIEGKAQKTFHLELTLALEEEVKALDAMTSEESFLNIKPARLPRLKDYLPVQYIESAVTSQAQLQPRQYDEKFHILQAPHLFLPDLAYFRAKCEERETQLALAFIDIDDFKSLNKAHTESKVDRNLLPRFMQTIEAHVFHHGYAYRQGGDEYLILLPSLSRLLALAFLDELRRKLADVTYPEIAEKTTISTGLCIVDSDCALTDRELRDRANRAKDYAKEKGKNCIATYNGRQFLSAELAIAAPGEPAQSPVT